MTTPAAKRRHRTAGIVRKRGKVLKASGGRCAYCGKGLTMATLTVDHIVPRCKGGSNALENLIASCEPCNQVKGAGTVMQFLPAPRR